GHRRGRLHAHAPGGPARGLIASDPIAAKGRIGSRVRRAGAAGPQRRKARMTVPHDTRPLPAASAPAALASLRARGLRISASRRTVVEALFAADGPVG